jgi:hypothetical protein
MLTPGRQVGLGGWIGAERGEQGADFVADLGRVSHRMFAVDGVVVASSDAGSLYVAGFDEFGHDALGCAFGNAHVVGDVAESDVGGVGQAEENLGVVGEEGPGLRLLRA